MSAASIIERVRAAGGEIKLAADGIKLRVPASLRDEVVGAVKANKNAVRHALKTETGDPWDAADYRCYYDERAGIAEFDGEMTREEAETAAFEAVVAEWLDRHHKASPTGECAWCGRPEDDAHAIVPIGQGNVHSWLHPECWPRWYAAQIDRAVSELAKAGIQRSVTTAQGGGHVEK